MADYNRVWFETHEGHPIEMHQCVKHKLNIPIGMNCPECLHEAAPAHPPIPEPRRVGTELEEEPDTLKKPPSPSP